MTTYSRAPTPNQRKRILLESAYKDHLGSVEFSALSRHKQDELIRILFKAGADFREWVIQNDVKHEHPYGLACIVDAIIRVATGEDFYEWEDGGQPLNDGQTSRALELIAGTKLAARLEEAFRPSLDDVLGPTDYNWEEMEKFAEIGGLEAEEVEELGNYLEQVPELTDGTHFGLPYKTYKEGWENGSLTLYVDRGLATQAFRHSKASWAHWLPLIFLGGLLTFIPVMIFVGFLWGLAILGLAILSRKTLSAKAEDWVRQDSLASPERYRWYSARKIIWAEKTKSSP